MISKKLKERMYLVKATPLPDRAKDAYSHRRSLNAVELEAADEEDKYDTFFDYEDDLANLKPSSEQYAEMVEEDSVRIGVLEDREPFVVSENAIIMDDNLDESSNDEVAGGYTDVRGFEFIQCSYIKKDGARCKRQAPKNSEICSTHKKYIEKHNLDK